MNAEKRSLVTFAAVLSLTASLTISGCKPNSGGDSTAKSGDKAAAGAATAPAAADNPPTPVNIVAASDQVVTRYVPVTGSVTALQSITLNPKVTANVLSVSGREGDEVHAGQIVVQLDPSDFTAQLRQAEANLLDARAKLTQAKTNYHIQLTQSETAVQNAESTLSAAEQNLIIAKQPQRTEQVRQSDIAVEQAQANYDRANADRKRYEYLVKEGAAAQSTLDQYVTTEAVQKANLDNAKENQKISMTGGRVEDIRASEEQVRQAKIALQLAKSNVQQNAVRMDDIRSAEASVAQNEATVAYQKQQVGYCTVRSPIDGIIASRTAEPGSLSGPGAASFSTTTTAASSSNTAMVIVALDTVYYQAQVSETDVAGVQSGKPVTIHVDAFPGRTFTGKVAGLYPTASTSSRNFNIRVTVPNKNHLLRPGMFARGGIVAEQRHGIVVPKDAVVGTGSDAVVYVAQDGDKAVRRPVKVGIQTSETSEILTGVHVGDQVIVAGQDSLKDGGPIKIVKGPDTGDSPTTAATGSAAPTQEASR